MKQLPEIQFGVVVKGAFYKAIENVKQDYERGTEGTIRQEAQCFIVRDAWISHSHVDRPTLPQAQGAGDAEQRKDCHAVGGAQQKEGSAAVEGGPSEAAGGEIEEMNMIVPSSVSETHYQLQDAIRVPIALSGINFPEVETSNHGLADGRDAREEGEFELENVGEEADTGNKLEDVVVSDDDSVDKGELHAMEKTFCCNGVWRGE
ncbi:hypothetical protein RHSIM_Rhsim07G0184500 [Rhododendron simsii]|uniref:Uncharacterized protein n=1 Tax=Rhododendron simsii TaxID=118357 RepID=A0A834GLZ4_RHOSS|nr:hypothetical protein RHSIM_Rhsim07G0184500 [Rhododendron simsii]